MFLELYEVPCSKLCANQVAKCQRHGQAVDKAAKADSRVDRLQITSSVAQLRFYSNITNLLIKEELFNMQPVNLLYLADELLVLILDAIHSRNDLLLINEGLSPTEQSGRALSLCLRFASRH